MFLADAAYGRLDALRPGARGAVPMGGAVVCLRAGINYDKVFFLCNSVCNSFFSNFTVKMMKYDNYYKYYRLPGQKK